MFKNDYRFDSQLLDTFIDKTFNKYKHKKFSQTNTVSVYVGFMVDSSSYEMCNDYENVDFMGWDNEATICRLSCKEWNDILNNIEAEVVERPVEKKISKITIINDHYISKFFGEVKYDWWETRTIIFNFGESEISFEKQDCVFSLEIEINKGYNLIEKVEDGKEILDDFEQSEKQTIEIEREIIELI